MFFSKTSMVSLPSKWFLSNNSSISDGPLKILGSLCSVLWLKLCEAGIWSIFFWDTGLPFCACLPALLLLRWWTLWPWAAHPSRRQLNSHHSQLKGWLTPQCQCCPGYSHSWDTPGQWQMKGLAIGCGGMQESGLGFHFQAALSELRTGFFHFSTKLQKLSAQLVASLQLQEMQLWALTYCRDSVITVTEEVSFWQVGLTWWHLLWSTWNDLCSCLV